MSRAILSNRFKHDQSHGVSVRQMCDSFKKVTRFNLDRFLIFIAIGEMLSYRLK